MNLKLPVSLIAWCSVGLFTLLFCIVAYEYKTILRSNESAKAEFLAEQRRLKELLPKALAEEQLMAQRVASRKAELGYSPSETK